MDEDGRKHLEFVQTVIARQASNSFLVKGWALTVAAAAYAFAVKERAEGVAVVGVMAVLAFWYLDAFFLRQERLFRCLYKSVIDPDDTTVPAFSMDTDGFKDNERSKWPAVLFTRTLWIFFGALAVVGLLAAVYAPRAQPAGDGPEAWRSESASSSSSAGGVG